MMRSATTSRCSGVSDASSAATPSRSTPAIASASTSPPVTDSVIGAASRTVTGRRCARRCSSMSTRRAIVNTQARNARSDPVN